MRDLRFWRWRKVEDDDLDRELEAHVGLATDERLEAGLPLRDAQLAARREFGSVTLTKEELRGMRAGVALERVWREARHAGRRLMRSPAFTVATVLTLGLAIGANVAIFAVVERVVMNPLPYPESGRLVMLDFSMPSRNIPAGFNSVTTRQYFHYAAHARTLAGLAVYRTEERTITGQGTPERVRVARSTPSLASVLGVAPEAGSWLPAANARGAAPTAVLSHGLWSRRYGLDRGILGQAITLDGIATTVVGVMPASFAFPDPRVDTWVSELFPPSTGDDSYSFTAVAKLNDGVSLATMRAEINQLSHALHADAPGNGYNFIVSTALPLREFTVGPIASALWVLWGSAAVVLLVACANIANLFLVRAEARHREIAVRRALGAGTAGIARYFLAESAVLSLAGAALGLLAAWYGVGVLVAFGPASLPRLHEIRLGPIHAVFSLALTALAALTFGIVPLLRLGSSALPLHHSGRGTTVDRRSHRARRLLMAGQVALSLVLLVASGLLSRSFLRLRALDPGFNPASALTFQVGLPRGDYPDRERIVRTHQAILDRLVVLPGVMSASAVNCVPLSGRGFCGGAPLFKDGETAPPGGDVIRPIVAIRPVAARFFETMGMPLVLGRGITEADVHGNGLVAVVNETLTRLAFPGQNPLGQRIRLGPHLRADLWFTIVGVVKTTPTVALAEVQPAPKMYVPMRAKQDVWPSVDVMTYVVRTSVPPIGLAVPVRDAVKTVDPNLALADVRTLQAIIDAAAAPRAFTMTLVIIAATTALLLGVIGIYGAMSYIVSQQTGEIGVRLALGAEPGRIARMIVRQGGGVAVAGAAVGLLAAFAGSHFIESLLYGVSPRDPSVFAGTTVLLLAVVLLACWLPARRAARLSPLEALRTE